MSGPQEAQTPEPGGRVQRLVENLNEVSMQNQENRWREQYLREFEQIIDGLVATTSPVGSMVASAAERFKVNEGYLKKIDWIRESLKDTGRRIIEVVIARAKARIGVAAETRVQLQELVHEGIGENLAMFKNVGESIKGRNIPYADTPTDVSDPGRDTMDTEEVLEFEKWADSMRAIDMEEMVDMVNEDWQFFDFIRRQKQGAGYDPFDPDAAEDPSMAEEHGHELERGELRAQMNMDNLVDFMLGKYVSPEKIGQKEKGIAVRENKSQFRKLSEGVLQQEIVRAMKYEQKIQLLATYLAKTSPAETKTFVAKCVISGTMTRRELQHMWEEDVHAVKSLGDDFEHFLEVAVKAKDIVKQRVEEEVRNVETQPVKSAITFFFTFNKLGAETIGRCGAIAAAINAGYRIMDKITGRKEGESWIGAGLSGVKDAVTDPLVIGGVAVAAAASEVVYPWVTEFAHAPDGAEKEKIGRYREMAYMRGIAEDHSEALDYFKEKYDAMLQSARVRKGQDIANPETGKEGEREFALYPGDLTTRASNPELKITPQKAGELGFASAKEAEAVMIRLFGICTSTFQEHQLINESRLEGFLQANIFSPIPVMASGEEEPGQAQAQT